MSFLRQQFMASRNFTALSAMIFFLVACRDQGIPPEGFVTLEGRATDQVSSLPLSGVVIKRNGSIEDSTDATGGYRIVYLNAVPAFDSLSFQREEYQTKLVSLHNATRTDSRVWRLNVQLEPD